jgi:hypothetical protein
MFGEGRRGRGELLEGLVAVEEGVVSAAVAVYALERAL